MADIADEITIDYIGTRHPKVRNVFVKCKFCGNTTLKWANKGTTKEPKWLLVGEDGNIHICQRNSWE